MQENLKCSVGCSSETLNKLSRQFISKRNKICNKGKRRFKLVSYLVPQAHFLSPCIKPVAKKLNHWEVLPGVLGKNRTMPTAKEDYGNKDIQSIQSILKNVTEQRSEYN